MRFFIYEGDAYSVLDKIAPNSIDICYTSPSPAFFELKKGVITDKRVLSTEENNIEYMNHLIAILQKVKRVPQALRFSLAQYIRLFWYKRRGFAYGA